MPGLKKIAVLTSGGDAPGMNAAIRAITRGALAKGWQVFGVHNGYSGLLADELQPLAARDVGGIMQSGGTFLGSARCPEFAQPAGRAQALANLGARQIDALVVIGGNGSQSGSASLAREGFPVVGVPSTIDNDLRSRPSTACAPPPRRTAAHSPSRPWAATAATSRLCPASPVAPK
jgi:6-phosphofructokinase 1